MKVCGIITAKKKSERFSGKNRFMFRHNLEIMAVALGKDNVFMYTDDKLIHDWCENNLFNYFVEPKRAADCLNHFSAMKSAYRKILDHGRNYDIIVTILCNTVGHAPINIVEAIAALQADPEAMEVKSFDNKGQQSGIFAFWADRLPEKRHRIVAINSNGQEIHYKEELKVWENYISSQK